MRILLVGNGEIPLHPHLFVPNVGPHGSGDHLLVRCSVVNATVHWAQARAKESGVGHSYTLSLREDNVRGDKEGRRTTFSSGPSQQ